MELLILGGCSGASYQGEYHGQSVLPCSYDAEYRSSLSASVPVHLGAFVRRKHLRKHEPPKPPQVRVGLSGDFVRLHSSSFPSVRVVLVNVIQRQAARMLVPRQDILSRSSGSETVPSRGEEVCKPFSLGHPQGKDSPSSHMISQQRITISEPTSW